ncbi:hypothetical protein BW35_02144 [Micrococcus luteus]|nr:hypothetical protein BW35_02144 [Micrococcus luteus]
MIALKRRRARTANTVATAIISTTTSCAGVWNQATSAERNEVASVRSLRPTGKSRNAAGSRNAVARMMPR